MKHMPQVMQKGRFFGGVSAGAFASTDGGATAEAQQSLYPPRQHWVDWVGDVGADTDGELRGAPTHALLASPPKASG